MNTFINNKWILRSVALLLVLYMAWAHITAQTARQRALIETARIIRVPTGLGADKYRGLELAPDVVETILRKRIEVFQLDATAHASSVPLRYQLEPPSRTWDVKVADVELHDNRKEFQTVHHMEAIVETSRDLKEKVAQTVKDKIFPIVIGGDHSIAIGTVAGLMASLPKQRRVGMIWIDGHADYNTGKKGDVIGGNEYESVSSAGLFQKLRPSTTNTGHIHGMPVAVCVGKGEKALTDIFPEGRFLDPRDIVMIGLRDVERDQREQIYRDGIRTFSAWRIQFEGIKNIAREAVRHLKTRGVSAVHISFDIDSLDGISVPGVSNPIDGGMSFREADLLIRLLRDWLPAQGIEILSFELAEVNPLSEGSINYQAARMGAILISTLLGEEILIDDSFSY